MFLCSQTLVRKLGGANRFVDFSIVIRKIIHTTMQLKILLVKSKKLNQKTKPKKNWHYLKMNQFRIQCFFWALEKKQKRVHFNLSLENCFKLISCYIKKASIIKSKPNI